MSDVNGLAENRLAGDLKSAIAQGWRPVTESLPADNEWVIVAVKTDGRYDVGIAKAVATQVRVGFDSTDMVPRITHWQYLPEPPKVNE